MSILKIPISQQTFSSSGSLLVPATCLSYQNNFLPRSSLGFSTAPLSPLVFTRQLSNTRKFNSKVPLDPSTRTRAFTLVQPCSERPLHSSQSKYLARSALATAQPLLLLSTLVGNHISVASRYSILSRRTSTAAAMAAPKKHKVTVVGSGNWYCTMLWKLAFCHAYIFAQGLSDCQNRGREHTATFRHLRARRTDVGVRRAGHNTKRKQTLRPWLRACIETAKAH